MYRRSITKKSNLRRDRRGCSYNFWKCIEPEWYFQDKYVKVWRLIEMMNFEHFDEFGVCDGPREVTKKEKW